MPFDGLIDGILEMHYISRRYLFTRSRLPLLFYSRRHEMPAPTSSAAKSGLFVSAASPRIEFTRAALSNAYLYYVPLSPQGALRHYA